MPGPEVQTHLALSLVLYLLWAAGKAPRNWAGLGLLGESQAGRTGQEYW